MSLSIKSSLNFAGAKKADETAVRDHACYRASIENITLDSLNSK